MTESLKPAIVFPFHDPNGVMFEHLKVILPILKHTFETAYLSVPKSTQINCPTNIDWLQKDEFFKLHFLLNDPSVWEHFHSLFKFAASHANPSKLYIFVLLTDLRLFCNLFTENSF